MFISETVLALFLGLTAVGFLGAFWLLPGGVIALWKSAGEIQVDLRPGYTPATLYRLLEAYGPNGVSSFRRMLWADMIFPSVYGAFLFVLADLGASASTNHIALAAAHIAQTTGSAAAGFDYLENIFLLSVLRRLPHERRVSARLAGISTSLKTAGILTTGCALAIMLVCR